MCTAVLYLLVEVSRDAIIDPLLGVVAGPPLSFSVTTLTAGHQLHTHTHTPQLEETLQPQHCEGTQMGLTNNAYTHSTAGMQHTHTHTYTVHVYVRTRTVQQVCNTHIHIHIHIHFYVYVQYSWYAIHTHTHTCLCIRTVQQVCNLCTHTRVCKENNSVQSGLKKLHAHTTGVHYL